MFVVCAVAQFLRVASLRLTNVFCTDDCVSSEKAVLVALPSALTSLVDLMATRSIVYSSNYSFASATTARETVQCIDRAHVLSIARSRGLSYDFYEGIVGAFFQSERTCAANQVPNHFWNVSAM